jgi:hypothetical protein
MSATLYSSVPAPKFEKIKAELLVGLVIDAAYCDDEQTL